jgi:hypothetical protein
MPGMSGELGHVRMNTMFHRTQSLSVVLADGTARTVSTPYLGNGYVHEAIERSGASSPGWSKARSCRMTRSLR